MVEARVVAKLAAWDRDWRLAADTEGSA